MPTKLEARRRGGDNNAGLLTQELGSVRAVKLNSGASHLLVALQNPDGPGQVDHIDRSHWHCC